MKSLSLLEENFPSSLSTGSDQRRSQRGPSSGTSTYLSTFEIESTVLILGDSPP
jgi:hypothetical protein